jgi:choice-of-anchor A domain-containing protein
MRNSMMVSAAAAACFGLSPGTATATAHVVTQWNLIVTGNLQNNSQDIEGRAFIGGNLTSGGSPTIGLRLTPASSFLGQTTLAVAGTTSINTLNLQAGNFRRSGTLSGHINFNGGGNGAIDPTLPAQATAIAGDLAALSVFLRDLTPNSTAQFPTGQPGPVRYNASPGGPDNLAVFSVSAADVFNNALIQQIELNAGSASSIIINVSGSVVNFSNGNMVGAWTSAFARANVLWNFHEATTLTFDRNFNGAVLAPLAHLTNSTNIDGSVFVARMTQNGEVHLPLYTGYIPSPGALVLVGAAGIAVARRRR